VGCSPRTGFAGNTLWDWFEVLLLPIVIVTVKFWTAERTIQPWHRWLLSAAVAGFVVFVVFAYRLPIEWSGFADNTLFDWVRLLLVPLLMPLLIVPATTNWFEKGIREEDEEEANEPVTYEIWLSPDRKLTAALVPASGDPGTSDLVVDGAYDVVRLTTANSGRAVSVTTAQGAVAPSPSTSPPRAPGRQGAADEEGGRGWEPAGLKRHSLIIANRPVLDHETVLDPLEVGLPHREGLTGRGERPFHLRVFGPHDEVAGVPAGHPAVGDDQVSLGDALLGRPAEIRERGTQPLAGGVERLRPATAGGRRLRESFSVGRDRVNEGDDVGEGAVENGVDGGLRHRHGLVPGLGVLHRSTFRYSELE